MAISHHIASWALPSGCFVQPQGVHIAHVKCPTCRLTRAQLVGMESASGVVSAIGLSVETDNEADEDTVLEEAITADVPKVSVLITCLPISRATCLGNWVGSLSGLKWVRMVVSEQETCIQIKSNIAGFKPEGDLTQLSQAIGCVMWVCL